MAIVKISALPAATAVAATDLVPIVDDPAGTPATQKATWSLARDYVLGVSGGTASIPENLDVGGTLETISAGAVIGGNLDAHIGTFTTSDPTPLRLVRSGVSNNVNIRAQNDSGTLYFGMHPTPGTWAVGGNVNLATAPWLTVTALATTAATFVGALQGNADTATTAGTVTTAAQPAITSVGTLTSLAVTGGVTAATFTGALVGNADTATTATDATNIGVTDAGSDTTTWVLLATGQTGTQGARTDGGLTYNASTNTLTAATFAGALSGNADTATSATSATTATTATNATNIGVTDAGSDTTTWVLLATGQTGTQGARTDTGLTYNASTNTLTATTFVGSLTGNALTATNATNIGVTDSGSDAATWVLLGANQTGTQGARTDGGLTYNASTNTLTAATFAGALSGNADTATSATSATTATTATTAGTVTTAAQPAITSVGTLTSLTVSGNLSLTGSGGKYIAFTRNDGIANIGGIGWHTDTAFYVGGHPSLSGTAGSPVRVRGFSGDLALGTNALGDVITIDGTTGDVAATGNLTITGDITTTGAGHRIITQASTGGSPGGAGFRLTPGSLPLTFSNGDMWCDNSGVYIRIGGVTKTFTLT